MPRIRRWHPVSHDFNRDREVQALRKNIADWMGYVWLEMLAEADRNDGLIKGTIGEIAASFAWVSLSDRPSFSRGSVEVGIRFMLDRGWLQERSDGLLVSKYAEYHKTREKKESRVGIQKAPLLTTLPILTPKRIKALSGKPDPIPSLIDHLNRKCGTSYKPNGKGTVGHLKARLRDFSPDDVKLVIDHKAETWGRDPKMVEYLRPETLFSTKFESYLQEAKREARGEDANP